MNDKTLTSYLYTYIFALFFVVVALFGGLIDSQAEKRKLEHDNQMLTTENMELAIEASQLKKDEK